MVWTHISAFNEVLGLDASSICEPFAPGIESAVLAEEYGTRRLQDRCFFPPSSFTLKSGRRVSCSWGIEPGRDGPAPPTVERRRRVPSSASVAVVL